MIFKHCTGVCSNSHKEIYRSCCRVRYFKFIKVIKKPRCEMHRGFFLLFSENNQ